MSPQPEIDESFNPSIPHQLINIIPSVGSPCKDILEGRATVGEYLYKTPIQLTHLSLSCHHTLSLSLLIHP